ASCPTASSFCACRYCSSSRWRAVTSRNRTARPPPSRRLRSSTRRCATSRSGSAGLVRKAAAPPDRPAAPAARRNPRPPRPPPARRGGRSGVGLESPTHLVPVEVGQEHVQDDHVGVVCGPAEGLAAGGALGHVEPVVAENPGEGGAGVVVIDCED